MVIINCQRVLLKGETLCWSCYSLNEFIGCVLINVLNMYDITLFFCRITVTPHLLKYVSDFKELTRAEIIH